MQYTRQAAWLVILALAINSSIYGTGVSKSAEDVQPVVLEAAVPGYSARALSSHATGEVVLEVKIDSNGSVKSVRAISGNLILVADSKPTARRWRFAVGIDKTGTRRVQLTFVYRLVPKGTPIEQLLPIFKLPYRIEVTHVIPEGETPYSANTSPDVQVSWAAQWMFEPYRINGKASLMAGTLSLSNDSQEEDTSVCEAKLEQAEIYELKNDPRAEAEFQRALSDGGKQCPDGLLRFSLHLSRNLRFGEAADEMQAYLKRTRAEERTYGDQDVVALRKAARLKEQVDGSSVPSLDVLLELIGEVNGYGRHHGDDAIPYAEKAVELYPASARALIYLAEFLSWKDKNRSEQLLNRAASIEPDNSKVYTARRLFYHWHHIKRDEAERDFRRALLLSNDTDDEAWKGLGLTLMERGQESEAIKAFRSYLRVTKAAPEVTSDVRMRLERLEKSP